MAAEPNQVIDGERPCGCDAMAIILETTGEIRIVKFLETVHQGIGAEETQLEETDLLIRHQAVGRAMEEHGRRRLVVAVFHLAFRRINSAGITHHARQTEVVRMLEFK